MKNANEFRQRWQPEPGSQMAALLDRLDQSEAEHTRLKALLAQRQQELAAVQSRLNNIRADVEPLPIAQDRLVLGVLPDLIARLKLAIGHARNEVDIALAQTTRIDLALQGKRAAEHTDIYLRAPYPGQPTKFVEKHYVV